MTHSLDQLSVSPERGITLAHQIKQQIALLISAGQLQPGDRLPTVRSLAAQLSVNLHTVRNAYHMLAADRLIEVRQGRGAHVLAFDPRSLAQAAPAARSRTVGVILPSFSNPFYHALLQGISEAAAQLSSLLFTCFTQDDPAEAWRYYAQLAARRVDGILLISTGLEGLDPAPVPDAEPARDPGRLPLVRLDWPGAAGPAVNLDLEGAGYQAVRHLVSHGHTRIGLVTYALDAPNVQPVNLGCRRALEDAGLALDPALVARVPAFDPPAGFEGARRLLDLPRPPTAIFAITDQMALGVLQAVRRRGLRVPQDIALVGFNDIPVAALLDPPLTTVALPGREMGQAAMHLLQELIAGRTPARTSLQFHTALVVRQSCGPHG